MKELLELAETLIGKNVSYVSHHDAYPSVYIDGIITKVEDVSYSYPKVEFTVESKAKTETFTACTVTVNNLIKDGLSQSGGQQWSRSTTTIRV